MFPTSDCIRCCAMPDVHITIWNNNGNKPLQMGQKNQKITNHSSSNFFVNRSHALSGCDWNDKHQRRNQRRKPNKKGRIWIWVWFEPGVKCRSKNLTLVSNKRIFVCVSLKTGMKHRTEISKPPFSCIFWERHKHTDAKDLVWSHWNRSNSKSKDLRIWRKRMCVELHISCILQQI